MSLSDNPPEIVHFNNGVISFMKWISGKVSKGWEDKNLISQFPL